MEHVLLILPWCINLGSNCTLLLKALMKPCSQELPVAKLVLYTDCISCGMFCQYDASSMCCYFNNIELLLCILCVMISDLEPLCQEYIDLFLNFFSFFFDQNLSNYGIHNLPLQNFAKFGDYKEETMYYLYSEIFAT